MTIKSFLEKFNYYYENQNNRNLNKGILHRIYIFIDYMISFVIEGCSLTNYFVYEFYNLKHKKKREFVTWRRQNWIYNQCNDDEYGDLLRDKKKINNRFHSYLKRDWLYTKNMDRESFNQFIKHNSVFIAKPSEGTEGEGIHKHFNLNENEKEELFNKYRELDYVFETFITQHPEINKIHPQSVNTIRITTIRTDEGVDVMSAALRMGRDGAINDNYTTGGIVAQVDVEKGIVFSTGVDKLNHRYTHHPNTHQQIVGLQLPYWDETIQFVNELAHVIPQIRYTGWDISITQNGPVLIEGNYRGNFHVQQHGDMIGKFPKYKETIEKIAKDRN